MSTENTQTHPSSGSRRALSSPAHVKVHEGFSGSSFPLRPVPEGSLLTVVHTGWESRSRVRCWDSSWVILLVKDKNHPALWGLSFRITHWSLSQYSLPSLSEGHKQCLLPLRRSLFSTGFKVYLLFSFLWPMKSQLFSVSGRRLQMKKMSQNKEENSATPKYCKIGFKVWNEWVHKPAELLVITDREEFGECFLIRVIWLGLILPGTKMYTAAFHSWKAQ